MIYPPRCAGCDGLLPPGTHGICKDCARTLKPCPQPEFEKRAFDAVYSVFTYRSVAESVFRFKYMGRQEYAAFYADAFVRRYGGLPEGIRVDALIPVPLHPAKERKRGYNQAVLLAEALGRRLNIPVRSGLVARIRQTKPQKNLDYYGRLNNLKNAFIVRGNDVKYRSVALVDDIFTTGSTAGELAALLKGRGVRRVYVFTPAMATKGDCF